MALRCLLTIASDLSTSAGTWFSNGYSQNIKFFYDLLVLLGHEPFFLVGQADAEREVEIRGKSYRVVRLPDLLVTPEPYDIAFEMGVSLSDSDRVVMREGCGARVVSVRYGISLVFDMEQMLHAETMTPGIHVAGSDMVWTSPHIAYGESYLRTIYGCPSGTAPYIWEPDFTDVRFDEPDAPGRTRDIYVMEPNMSVLKNALVPLAIIEQVYRRDPAAFGKAMILNSSMFFRRVYFLENVVRNLSSLRAEAEKVYFTPRALFRDALQKPDLLLGHQWGCSLNYLYMEALYAGIPFVHNAPELQAAGYYYPEFDVDRGAEQTLRALREHDVPAARRRHVGLLRQFSIRDESVQRTYRRLLDQVMDLPLKPKA